MPNVVSVEHCVHPKPVGSPLCYNCIANLEAELERLRALVGDLAERARGMHIRLTLHQEEGKYCSTCRFIERAEQEEAKCDAP